MRSFATLLLGALLVGSAASAQTISFQNISTGTVTARIYNNGIIGDNCDAVVGFSFNGDNGLCGAGFLWGISASSVLGDAYLTTNATGWTPTAAITNSTSFPYPSLTNGRRTAWANAANNLAVEMNAYWGTANTDFIVFRYDITNTGATARTGYPGLFADWDVSGAGYASNLAAADVANNNIYVWDGQSPQVTPNYFGTEILSHDMVGWRYDTDYPPATGQPHLPGEFWDGLTVAQGTTSPQRDQRIVQGHGPVTIQPGDTFTFVYAFIAGSSLADYQANASAARGSLTPPVLNVLASRTLNTGTAALRVFNNGYFGADAGVPVDTTFNFGGFAPLYEGQLLVAVGPAQVSGQPYSASPQGPTPGQYEWSFGPRPYAVPAPAPFTSALMTTYNDTGLANGNPAGLSVSQRALARTGDDFVIVEATVTNNSTTAYPNAYIGMFADYDISATATNDAGAYDAATRTVWARNLGSGNTNYYGVTLIGNTVSGWNVSAETTSEAGLYTALTAPGTPATTGADRRLIIGAGPFNMAPGASQLVRFAYVAGTNAADILANAASAQALFPVAGQSGPLATDSELGLPAPNPVTTAATMELTVDRTEVVRVAVYDALGREVAVLHEGVVSTGTSHTLRLDASTLPAGVYVVRATGETFRATRRIIVSH